MTDQPDQMFPTRTADPAEPGLRRPLPRTCPSHHCLRGRARAAQFGSQHRGKLLSIRGPTAMIHRRNGQNPALFVQDSARFRPHVRPLPGYGGDIDAGTREHRGNAAGVAFR